MYCAKCGKEISGQQAYCNHCGHALSNIPAVPYPVPPASTPKNKNNIGCGCVAIFLVIAIVGAISSINGSKQNNNNDEQATELNAPAAEFSAPCGIEASAHMQSDAFINHPELTITVKNISQKDIAAIKFLAIPYDVYGEEIKSFATQERLQTDDIIRKGVQKQIHYGPFILANIKSVKLYVYSVYYTDGTHWGNKDASRSEILRNAKRIEATFEQ